MEQEGSNMMGLDSNLVLWGWLAFGVVSSVVWNLSLRQVMKGEHDEAAAGTASNFLTILFTVPFILLLGANFSFRDDFSLSSVPAIAWLACILGAGASVVFTYLTFKASKVVDASERAIFSRLNVFWALIFAAALLGESITPAKLAAVALIFLASALSVYKTQISKWKTEGLQLVVIGAAFSAGTAIASKYGVGLMPPFVFAIFESTLLTLGLCLLMRQNALGRSIAALRRHPLDILINGLAGATFYAASLVAFTLLPASTVVPVMATAVVLTAIAGGLLLHEKEGWLQKVVAALLAVVGVWLISGA